jgi:hypothetical protein
MFSVAQNRPLPRRRWLSRERTAVAAPIIVVIAVLSLLIASSLISYHGNPAGFTVFGSRSVQYTHPPTGAPLTSPIGYDGQFYWIEARDPLLLSRSTFADMRGPGGGYHFQRPAYPALAFLLAGGRLAALPWTLLMVNVLAIVGVTAAVALYCRRRGWSCWWALAIGLMPGLLMPALRDLTDTLGTAAAVAGLLAWYSHRRWWAAALLSVAVLSREPLCLVAVGVAVESGVLGWRLRRDRPGLRRLFARSWPPVIVPAAAYLAWQAYIRLQAPVIPGAAKVGATSPPLTPSLAGVWDRVHQLLAGTVPLVAGWEVVYLVLIIIAIVAAIRLAFRGSAAGVSALLLASTLLVIQFGDQWGLVRYSAPLFAMVLIGGLQEGSRFGQRICIAAAGMSLYLPWLAGL